MRCSKNVEFFYRWISESDVTVPNEYIVNYPDIHETFVDMWANRINAGVNSSTDPINRLGESIINAIQKSNWDLTYENGQEEFRIFKERGHARLTNELQVSCDGISNTDSWIPILNLK
tara:strand:- start:67589 stop:67942 length:354 start_codon:yes stop_codon:yes gene_type:complete